ncbi:hypothetical protein KP509_28G068200 [Ceratopteris richardii]|uniref:Uncharacterized protein n=1 Tax=Ceratopteris richardii TaxID=49495 RepID=A0A8T2RD91_CERRI|nr:hypothetical protein KP509_28G068200 [Ceratopteris richardii]
MSLRGTRCGKHPSHLLVGVCSFCLRERLSGLAEVNNGAAETTKPQRKDKKWSPERIPAEQLVAGSHDSRRQYPSGKEGGLHKLPYSVSYEALNKDNSEARISNVHVAAPADVVMENSVAGEDGADAHSSANKVDTSSTSVTLRKISAGAADHHDYAGASGDLHSVMISDMDSDAGVASLEMSPSMRGLTVTSKGCSSDICKFDDLRTCDIKVPIVENNQLTVSGPQKKGPSRNHTSMGGTSTLDCKNKEPVVLSSSSEAHQVASVDNDRNINGIARAKTLPSSESAVKHVKVDEIVLSGSSAIPKQSKHTLSSLFTLDDAECTLLDENSERTKTIPDAKEDALVNLSMDGLTHTGLHAKSIQKGSRHGSFSERVEQNAYLFPVPETTNSKSVSWFSNLFQRHKKKFQPKSLKTSASYTEHKNGCLQDARRSWDAPRPSSWEQWRLSSFERPRSSWEPARPSWEGVIRPHDIKSVVRGFSSARDSAVELREDGSLSQKSERDLVAGDCTNGFVEEKKSDVMRLVSKPKPLVAQIPALAIKDKPLVLDSAKSMSTQRDVSTQTTPPRASDATEFIQQGLQNSHHQHEQQNVKASHAVWSKVWAKRFTNSKWAFKQKHCKESQEKEKCHPAVVSTDEVQDQGIRIAEKHSYNLASSVASKQHHEQACVEIKDHEAWDTFYSPLQDSRNVITRLALKGVRCVQEDETLNEDKVSGCSIENGLHKLYVTPIRGHGKDKQGLSGVECRP